MRKIVLLGLWLFVAFPLWAQGPGLPGDDPDMPIDGGMLLLMAAGMAYGVKTLRKSKE